MQLADLPLVSFLHSCLAITHPFFRDFYSTFLPALGRCVDTNMDAAADASCIAVTGWVPGSVGLRLIRNIQEKEMMFCCLTVELVVC